MKQKRRWAWSFNRVFCTAIHPPVRRTITWRALGQRTERTTTRCARNQTEAWCELDQSRNAYVNRRVMCAWPTTEHASKFAQPDWSIIHSRDQFCLLLLFTWPARSYILGVASQPNERFSSLSDGRFKTRKTLIKMLASMQLRGYLYRQLYINSTAHTFGKAKSHNFSV